MTKRYIIGNRVPIQLDDEALDFTAVHATAKEKAREISTEAMMLSWCNNKKGEYYPNYECGARDKPAWVVAAEARGGDMTIDVNDGKYLFVFLSNPTGEHSLR